MPETHHTLILYDGICGLCNRFNRFVIDRDGSESFLFAPLQSGLAREILTRHGLKPESLDTLIVVPDYPDESLGLLSRSRAALFVGRRLPVPWNLLSRMAGLLPLFLLDLGYRLVAANRYRLFGKKDSCPIPSPADRKRFLDL